MPSANVVDMFYYLEFSTPLGFLPTQFSQVKFSNSKLGFSITNAFIISYKYYKTTQ